MNEDKQYTYKGKPYGVLMECKFKVSDLASKKSLPWWKRWLLKLVFGRSLWIDMVIYQCLYENKDGMTWSRDKEIFYQLFKEDENS